MLIAVWPLVVCVIGVLLWALTAGKISDIGKWMFIVGLLWTVYALSGHTLKLG